ncbi:MAG: flagellar motor switch phosphatase FliY [Halanaerobium sp.]|nr:flagellar motor switch phosphatase FliY [Halanaerobium sp.]
MNMDDLLSQEEIDALLQEKSLQENGFGKELSEHESDVIGEMGNISMGSAATALHNLISRMVQITTPSVSITSFNELIDRYDRPCVVVQVEYIEGLEGSNILILQELDSAIIADLMMGGDGNNPPEELDELHISAVGEAMNQMMGSVATSMSNIFNEKVNISPPQTELLELNTDVAERYELDMEEKLVEVSFRMTIDDLVDSFLVQLMPIPFARKLVNGLTESQGILDKSEDEERRSAPKASGKSDQALDSAPAQARKEAAVAAEAPAGPTSGSVQKGGDVAVRGVGFPEFEGNDARGLRSIDLLQDVPLEITVQLGKTRMKIKDILELGDGAIVELDKLAGEPVDLLVNGKLIAIGEVVVIDENFGFRVKEIISPSERVKGV